MSDLISAAALAKKAVEMAQMALKLRSAYDNYRDEHEAQWWQKVIESYPGKTPNEVASELESRFHDIEARERAIKAVWQSYRTFMESVDDRVLPALAALTADYLSKDKRPDFFFRGVCRMLGDMSYGEYVTIREVISDALARIKQHGSGHEIIKIWWWHNKTKQALSVRLVFSDKSDETYREVFENYERVMYLLHHNNLAESPTISGGAAFIMDASLIRRLNAILT